ncbi:MAG: hypothetical protein OSA21_08120, partial [Candidatus Poseidoniaceae archaeon]|nr:hypothetical protein [Candidatus Poseidoniaceae archaeon]
MQNDLTNGRGVMFVLFFIMVLSPMGPMADVVVGSADAAGVSRHIYSLHDGSSEYVALYQGANPDVGAMVSLPKGALVTEVSMTLSGASATGWSQTVTDDRDEWIEGTTSAADARSGELGLAFSNRSTSFFPHSYDELENPSSDAWLDNGSYAVRQPHTSNSTESRFSQQALKTSSNLMKQSQGAILKHHDWLFMSTWSTSTFQNIVHRLYPNNATKESVITLDQGQCTLP